MLGNARANSRYCIAAAPFELDHPRVERKGLFGASLRSFSFFTYSETRIVVRDSQSNRLKSEDTENTGSVY